MTEASQNSDRTQFCSDNTKLSRGPNRPFSVVLRKKKTYFWTFECGSSGGYRDSPTLIVNGGVEAPSEKCSPSLAPTMRCRGQRFASLLSAEGRVCFSYLRIQDWSSDVYVRRSTIKA